jgi:hypothetical protein
MIEIQPSNLRFVGSIKIALPNYVFCLRDYRTSAQFSFSANDRKGSVAAFDCTRKAAIQAAAVVRLAVARALVWRADAVMRARCRF